MRPRPPSDAAPVAAARLQPVRRGGAGVAAGVLGRDLWWSATVPRDCSAVRKTETVLPRKWHPQTSVCGPETSAGGWVEWEEWGQWRGFKRLPGTACWGELRPVISINKRLSFTTRGTVMAPGRQARSYASNMHLCYTNKGRYSPLWKSNIYLQRWDEAKKLDLNTPVTKLSKTVKEEMST